MIPKGLVVTVAFASLLLLFAGAVCHYEVNPIDNSALRQQITSQPQLLDKQDRNMTFSPNYVTISIFPSGYNYTIIYSSEHTPVTTVTTDATSNTTIQMYEGEIYTLNIESGFNEYAMVKLYPSEPEYIIHMGRLPL